MNAETNIMIVNDVMLGLDLCDDAESSAPIEVMLDGQLYVITPERARNHLGRYAPGKEAAFFDGQIVITVGGSEFQIV